MKKPHVKLKLGKHALPLGLEVNGVEWECVERCDILAGPSGAGPARVVVTLFPESIEVVTTDEPQPFRRVAEFD